MKFIIEVKDIENATIDNKFEDADHIDIFVNDADIKNMQTNDIVEESLQALTKLTRHDVTFNATSVSVYKTINEERLIS